MHAQQHVDSVHCSYEQQYLCLFLECITFHFVTVSGETNNVIVTVTEALVLRPLLEDRGRITESLRILVPVYRMTRPLSRM